MTRTFVVLGLLLCAFPACADEAPRAEVVPEVVEHGRASYYNDKFQGKLTASGELHDQNALTAASRDLPLGSTVRVINLDNGKAVDVEITDRGPHTKTLVIDLSRRAADSIGMDMDMGVAPVRVEASAGDQPTVELKRQVAAVGAKKRAAQKRHADLKNPAPP